MRLFVVMVNDRHADPEPYVFSTPEAAIEYARQAAADNARDQADIEDVPVRWWLLHLTYSVEGDSVWVVEKNLDEGEPS